MAPNAVVEWVTLAFSFLDVPGTDLGPETSYSSVTVH
jgi:hypothetical protein